MKGLSGVLFASLAISSAAHAQEWQTYTYPDPGFAIQFPGVPIVQTTKLKNAAGVTLPVTRYVVRQDGVEYTLSVVNYSSTNADALGAISEFSRLFSAKGTVNANTGARVNGNHGRELTITEGDGSRSNIAIFFVNNHLYTAVGRALPPNSMERSADTAHFRQSLQFLADEDSGFLGLFGGRKHQGSDAAASTVTGAGANGASVGTGTRGSTGSAGEHLRTVATQRADAACIGKSAGDVVQLDTPTGPVPATCTLTARPNPPSGRTSEASPHIGNSNGTPNAAPPN